MKSQVRHTVWYHICGEAAGEIRNWPLLGVKGLNVVWTEKTANDENFPTFPSPLIRLTDFPAQMIWERSKGNHRKITAQRPEPKTKKITCPRANPFPTKQHGTGRDGTNWSRTQEARMTTSWWLRSERSSSSYFLHRKNVDLLDRVRMQLDNNSSRACNHNALRHLASQWHVLPEFLRTRKKPLIRNFVVCGMILLASLQKLSGASAGITICWYTHSKCLYLANQIHQEVWYNVCVLPSVYKQSRRKIFCWAKIRQEIPTLLARLRITSKDFHACDLADEYGILSKVQRFSCLQIQWEGKDSPCIFLTTTPAFQKLVFWASIFLSLGEKSDHGGQMQFSAAPNGTN